MGLHTVNRIGAAKGSGEEGAKIRNRACLRFLGALGYKGGFPAKIQEGRPIAFLAFLIDTVGEGWMDMYIKVECYSGYKADERPLRFRLGGKLLEVEEILDRWYGEEHDYFKLRAEDGNKYLLRHGRKEDVWELTMFEGKNLPPDHPW
jgi:hypothetical protein